MSFHNPPRGGAAVGVLTDLDAVETAAVIYLRLWADRGNADTALEAEFTNSLGHHLGTETADTLNEIGAMIAHYGRRPLMRHQVGCKCLGADEACFANLIGAASEGNREDAMLMAALIVRPDVAPALAQLAQTYGLALRRMANMADELPTYSPSKTLH